jgi:hypothetical protein
VLIRRAARRRSRGRAVGAALASVALVAPDFWDRTLQNWQSEFLAILSMAVLSIYLRQRGSPESKPVAAAHSATGLEG